MSSLLCKQLVRHILNFKDCSSRVLTAQPVRFAVKKKRNYDILHNRYNPKLPFRHIRGIQVEDNSIVHKGDVLVKQMGLEFYPGLNVRLNRENWDLIAVRDGQFLISTETLQPYPDSPIYDAIKAGRQIEKQFVHVVADPLPPVFKLKSQI